MDSSSSDNVDVYLESTVLMALSKLQKVSKKLRKSSGVPCKKVVEFLKANYSWVDGDVESQVMTALMSCIKSGFVCALNNQKYLLLRANPSNMSSQCVTRVSHGPSCNCLSALDFSLRGSPRTCCVIKKDDPFVNKPVKGPKRKLQSRRKPSQPSPRNPKKAKAKKPRQTCVEVARNLIGTSRSNISLTVDENDKCNYCFEVHSLPRLESLCMTCYPAGKFKMHVSPDKFSPRDEQTHSLIEIL